MRASQWAHSATQPQALQNKLGRIAAPIQEHDHLPAGLQMPPDCLHRGLREPCSVACLRRSTRVIRGARADPDPLRQQQARVAPLRDVLQGLERRCRRAQDDRDLGALRAPDGEIARRIAKPFMLLIGGVVLLVDHDEPEVRQRGEHRRAGADDDSRLPAVRRAPGIAAQAAGSAECMTTTPALKRRAEALDELRRQRDFGHQHQHLAAAGPSAAAMTCKYTSVLPLPVTPYNRCAANRPSDAVIAVDDLRLRVGERDLAGTQLEGRRLRWALATQPSRARASSSVCLRPAPGGCAGLDPRVPPPLASPRCASQAEQGALPRSPPGRAGRSSSCRPAAVKRPRLDGHVGRLTRAQARRQRRRHDFADADGGSTRPPSTADRR